MRPPLFTLRKTALLWAGWLIGLGLAGSKGAAADANWREYLGGPDRGHFSSLDQIKPDNVSHLQIAWEYHTGVPGEMQCNPLEIDGVLYGMTAASSVFALDAATGRERWHSAPSPEQTRPTFRGVTYWADGDNRRIYYTMGSWLCALDARTGLPIESFGENGKTSLKAGLGDSAQDKWVVSTTPGTVFEDLLIVPTRVTESADAAPGFVQAFSVRTGKLAWVFYTIPRPGELGYETWSKDAYKNSNIGSANSWPGMAIDRARGLLFVPTGSASPDFWGANRKGQNLFANCLLALDARTGKLRWHYQFVHHDLWDRDLPAPPNLITLRQNGKKIDAVAQITKSGRIFVFDRLKGTPLFPIEEKPVAKSELPEEEAWPTQPEPALPKPFARVALTENDLSPYAENRDELLAKFRGARTGPFQPFGTHDTIIFPGFDGGAEWGGAAVDPDGVLYVNSNEMAWVARLNKALEGDQLSQLSPGHRLYATYCSVCHGPELQGNATSGFPSLVALATRRPRDEIAKLIVSGKDRMPGFPMLSAEQRQVLIDFILGTEKVEGVVASSPTKSPGPIDPYEFGGYVKFLDSKGYPAISPPWGQLTAIDLNTGAQRWQIRLGEFKELTAKGIPLTGTENYGGPIVTASGLLFIAATKDGMFRAFARKTGKQLWEAKLPAAGFATPSTYSVNGKQYIAIACGGSKLGTEKGDSYVAFALP